MAYNFDDRSSLDLPDYAMVLAAGFGRRMMPLTEDKPKPLLSLGHQTIIDYTLDRFEDAGIPNIVVNVHYKADMMVSHLYKRSRQVRICQEETPLETGGGITAALPYLGAGRFFIANGDSVWIDGAVPTLDRLAALWNESTMDALLLLVSTPDDEDGDYEMNQHDGKLTYRPNRKTGEFMYAGLALLHARLFQKTPDGAFRLPVLFHEAERNGRLYGAQHNGKWYHLSTPEALSRADAEFRAASL